MDFIKKTKIVATLGPSSSESKIIEKMILEGVNVFRINFSHADYKLVKEKVEIIRALDKKLNTSSSILGDLQGPKIRLGKIEEDIEISEGEEYDFYTDKEFIGNKNKGYVNYNKFSKDLSKGENILIDDGKLIFKVISSDKKSIVKTKVIQGGLLKSNKGVNLPNTKISLPALTKKDLDDAKFIFNNNFDWIALSFVRSKNDITDLKKLMKKNANHEIPIIAKIEKPEAINNIDEIIKFSDGLMVARGDLGIEIPAEEVPLIQKELVNKAKSSKIPIIIATQMMESMIENLSPSRAEVNDVANSVMDGADAVMLSGETSVGNYPIEVVKSMSSIIKAVEDSDLIKIPQPLSNKISKRFISDSICSNAANMANEIKAKAISTLTYSGYTAYQISAWRPNAHILVFSSNKKILTQLNLLWGVKAFYYNNFKSTDKTVEEINEIALNMGYIQKKDLMINLTSMPVKNRGMANTLRISVIE
ncbi:MAG: pyruvate kinase [Flavobacteriaceae bacterium]